MELKVVAASINLKDPQATHEVEQVITHENYNAANSWINDIALLKVKQDLSSRFSLQIENRDRHLVFEI